MQRLTIIRRLAEDSREEASVGSTALNKTASTA